MSTFSKPMDISAAIEAGVEPTNSWGTPPLVKLTTVTVAPSDAIIFLLLLAIIDFWNLDTQGVYLLSKLTQGEVDYQIQLPDIHFHLFYPLCSA
tara:strand:+ start:122 stop:403 length:282 start_codon:yes stop_codon:yes gene_type:complete